MFGLGQHWNSEEDFFNPLSAGYLMDKNLKNMAKQSQCFLFNPMKADLD